MKQNKKGFTMVELLLYMSLLTILLIVLTTLFVQILDVRLESEADSSTSSEGQFIMSRLAYDIGRADAVLIPTVLGDQTNSLQLTISGINYNYVINSNNLTLTDAIGTEKLNTTDTRISNLTFTRLGNTSGKNTIRLQYAITSSVSRISGRQVENFQTTIGLR